MPRPIKLLATFLFASLLLSSVAFAQQDDEERRRAFQLFKEAKYTEALPAFEKLAATHPNDAAVIETYGLLVLGQAAFLKDPAARKQARVRGREILLQAEKLGADSPLLKTMLASVPPDGGEGSNFSTKKEAEEAMREGEAAFSNGDYDKAIDLYQKALLVDPALYEAPLFIGDVYFKKADQQKAGEWYGRAVAINPDRETAYRYWGDALMRQGRVTEAGEKFVESFIAEPYNRLARAGFVNWGQRVNIPLAHPKVELPASVTRKQEGGATITLDPNVLKKDDKSGSGAAWMMYGIIRASWSQSEFAKNYPNEKTYRHSLKEEAAALRGALKAVENQKDQSSIDPSLQILRKLDKEGLLEAFILLAMPDEGIANDFAEYRKTNIENLRRYVKQYVLTGGGQ
ncbi:MAG TPA: tetratricopeptide repeat protein [Pyrinomonadaceae bacterium]|nr:tetratricopeptide repeat protein [Pyrinomonadaceae bacterium]